VLDGIKAKMNRKKYAIVQCSSSSLAF